MGKRGPPKKPAEQCASWRGDPNRKGSNAYKTPKPKKGRPAKPPGMSKEAQQLWTETLPLLEDMRVLTKADRRFLQKYCQTFVVWERCCNFVEEKGVRIETKGGGIKQSPEAAMMSKLGCDLVRLENLLGLNPSARAGMQAQPEEAADDDPVGAFLPKMAER